MEKEIRLSHLFLAILFFAIVLVADNLFLNRTFTSISWLGLYYAVIMLVRFFVLAEHERKNGPSEINSEKVKRILHEAGYKTFRLMIVITLIFGASPVQVTSSISGLSTGLIATALTIFTILEINIRLSSIGERG